MENIFTFKNFIELSLEEKEMIFHWRNHVAVRKVMYSSSKIELDAHLNFIDRLHNARNTKSYFLVFKDGISVGVMSVHYEDKNKVDFGYYISPEYIGKDLSVIYYYKCLEFIFEELGVDVVIGYIKKENKEAYLLTKLFGFTRVLTQKEIPGDGLKDYYYVELNRDSWSSSIKDSNKIRNIIAQSKDI